jgi:predicted RNA methylase
MDFISIKETLDKAYKDIDGYKLSSAACQKLSFSYKGYEYGGATIRSFYENLQYIPLNSNDIFLDLGSGIGEKVLIAALMYPNLKLSIGIEELADLDEAANIAHNRISSVQSIPISEVSFIQHDFFDIPIKQADLVYISIQPTILEIMLHGLLLNHLNTLKYGSKVLVTQIPIVSDTFTLLWQRPYEHKYGMGTMYLFEKR